MDDETRVALIRQGNALMQEKRYKEALACFLKAEYQDGLVRVGDVLYEQKNYAGALKVYVKAGHPGRIEATAEKVAAIIHSWLEEDKQIPSETKEIQPWKPVVLSLEDIMKIGNAEHAKEQEPSSSDEIMQKGEKP
jgi:tetratricopeptide (TPR) repeat protein